MKNSRLVHQLRHDLALIVLSVLVALILVKTQALSGFLTMTAGRELWGSFFAGLFFTSVFTTAPAMVTLGQIAAANSLYATAFLGALGAATGDLIIFRFFRDRFGRHVMELLRHQGAGKRLRALLHLRFFRWFLLMLGGLIIASPLPDELGISFLGLSRSRGTTFLLISFLANFLGILAIGLVAKAV